MLEKLPEIHKRIALKLVAEFPEKHGVRIVVDTQVYEPARILRLDPSLHSGVKAFSIPFRPDMLDSPTWDNVRGRQRSPRYVLAAARTHNGVWSRIVEPESTYCYVSTSLPEFTKPFQIPMGNSTCWWLPVASPLPPFKSLWEIRR